MGRADERPRIVLAINDVLSVAVVRTGGARRDVSPRGESTDGLSGPALGARVCSGHDGS